MIGLNVKERHELILGAIGVFPEEEIAYSKALQLLWMLPLVVMIASIFDVFMVVIYMRYAHPWRGILFNKGGLIYKIYLVNST